MTEGKKQSQLPFIPFYRLLFSPQKVAFDVGHCQSGLITKIASRFSTVLGSFFKSIVLLYLALVDPNVQRRLFIV